MTATSDEATAELALRCEEAARLAEGGELDRAAALFEDVLAAGDTPLRGRAALGLAVVRAGLGDESGARAADEIAIATGDAEYAPRAAYHLALSHEREGDVDAARAAWQRVVDFGNPAYLPPAGLALAQLADEDGDDVTARRWWEQVLASGVQPYAAIAGHDLAQRLLEDGEAAAALRVLDQARGAGGDAAGSPDARLSVASALAHLDLAIAALGEAVRTDDPEVTPLAVELLARALPLRGRTDDARRVWEHGLGHADPRIAEGVRSRLRRDLDSSGVTAWWDAPLEAALVDNTLPELADEVFAALDRMYVLVAMPYAEQPPDLPADLSALLGETVRVPSDYSWGAALHASFAERVRAAMGATGAVLPDTWPDMDEAPDHDRATGERPGMTPGRSRGETTHRGEPSA